MGRRSLATLYDDTTEAPQIFCPDCLAEANCPKAGLPKVTAANRAAFIELQTKNTFPAYLPQPFYAALRDRILIIEGEMAKIQNDKAEENARRTSG